MGSGSLVKKKQQLQGFLKEIRFFGKIGFLNFFEKSDFSTFH